MRHLLINKIIIVQIIVVKHSNFDDLLGETLSLIKNKQLSCLSTLYLIYDLIFFKT